MRTAKVEVWDVVDKAKDKKGEGEQAVYYINSGSSSGVVGQADAEVLDIYRGANALVVVTDPGRRETLEYLEEVLADPARPANLPVAILANFKDKQTKEAPQITQADYDRIVNAAPKTRFFFQCSMRSCFGLKELYEFMAVPFLQVPQLLPPHMVISHRIITIHGHFASDFSPILLSLWLSLPADSRERAQRKAAKRKGGDGIHRERPQRPQHRPGLRKFLESGRAGAAEAAAAAAGAASTSSRSDYCSPGAHECYGKQ